MRGCFRARMSTGGYSVMHAPDRNMKHILLADDDTVFLSSLAEILRLLDVNYAILTAENGSQAAAIMDTQPIDLLITDLRMPVMDGLELALRTAENHPEIPVIVMSACVNIPVVRELGADIPCIDKPLDLDKLIGAIQSLLHVAT